MRVFRILVSSFAALVIALLAIIGGTPGVGATGTWQTKAPMPTARFGTPSAVIDGRLYVVSGCCVDHYNGDVSRFTALEVYDPVTDGWTSRSPIPTGVYGATTGVLNGKLHVAGGHAKSSNIPTVQIYDPASNTWSTGKPLPEGGGGSTGGVIAGKLYVAGGMNPSNISPVRTLRVFDPVVDAWTTAEPMPTGRAAAGSAIVGGKLYVVGGHVNGPRNELEVYDPIANTWTVLAPMPTARSGVGVGVLNGILYAVGGYDNVHRLDLVEAYDPSTNTWTMLGPMPEAHYWPAVGTIGQNMYVVGGEDVAIRQSVQNHVLTAPIAQASPTITITGGTFTYDKNSHAASATVTGTGGVTVPGAVSLSYVPGGFAPPTNAGSYGVTAVFTSADPGYKDATVFAANAVTIDKAVPTVFVSGGTFTYNGSPWPSMVSATGVGGEPVSGSIGVNYQPGGAQAPRTIGTYTALATLTTSSFSNYTGASGTAAITIDPSTATLNGPNGLTVEAMNHGGAMVTFSVSAFDFDGSLTPTCSPASGSLFPLGQTHVTCTASGANSVPGTKTFPVTVTDTRPPIIGFPPNYSIQATSAQGAIVTFPLPPVSDQADPAPTVTASPASGSLFPHGTTSVLVTARDASGNSTTRSFTVTVTASMTSIGVSPASVTLSPGQDRQFTATATFTDGSTKILPNAGGGGGGSSVIWQFRFLPTLRVDACGPGAAGGFSSQPLSAQGGTFNSTWSPLTPLVRVTGTVTASAIAVTLTCTNPALGSPVSLTATWTGTRYEGTFTNFSGATVQAVITGWSQKAPMPTPRFALGAAVLPVNGQDQVFVVGGRSNTSFLGTVESYDLSTNSWTAQPSMPTPRAGAGVAALNGRLYVVGGNVAAGTPSGVTESFDPSTGAWSTGLPAMPTPRAHFSLVAAGGRLYAIGGDSPSGVVGTVERFDPVQGWTTLAPMPTARRFTAAGALNNGGLIIVAGGTQASGPALNRTELYDVVANTWTLGPNMLAPAAGAAAAVASNALFVFGGNAGGALNTAQMYRPASGPQQPAGWASMSSLPTARSESAAATVGDVIYVAGGQTGSTGPQPGLAAFEAFSILSPSHFAVSQGGAGSNTLPTPAWRLSPASGVATIDSSGRARATAPGQVIVLAEAGGLSCLTTATCAILRVADTVPPVLALPAAITAEASSAAGAVVDFSATALDGIDGAVAVQCSWPSGSTFPVGSTQVACSAADSSGNAAHGTFRVVVQDTRPPIISSATPSLAKLWPVNHKMVPVTIAVVVSDVADPSPVCQVTGVSSSEPGTSADWQITPGTLTLTLRAARTGAGSGRVYTVVVTCSDRSGNAASRSTTVLVPHDQGGKE